MNLESTRLRLFESSVAMNDALRRHLEIELYQLWCTSMAFATAPFFLFTSPRTPLQNTDFNNTTEIQIRDSVGEHRGMKKAKTQADDLDRN